MTGPVLLVNGQPQSITVIPTQQDEGLSISGDGFSMTIEGVGSTGTPLGLTPDGALILENDRFAKTSGTGFLADSPVKLFLFSDPVYVGDVVTNGDGAFSGSVQIPLTIAPGRHTLQANGYTPSGQIRSLSLPVVVKADEPDSTSSRPTKTRKANATVLFAPLSAELTTQAKATLSRLVKKAGKTARVTTVVGFVQGTASTINDVQLSTHRARSVTTYLREQGLRGKVTYRGEGVSHVSGPEGRRVAVHVTYRR